MQIEQDSFAIIPLVALLVQEKERIKVPRRFRPALSFLLDD